MRRHPFAPGQVIIRQGDPAEEFYVLTRGRVQVTLEGVHPDTPPLAYLSAPSWFGELALLTNQARVTTVTAVTRGEAWILGRRDFDALLVRHPAVARNLMVYFCERIVQKDQDFVGQSRLAIDRAQLLADLGHRSEELAALGEVTRAVSASLDLGRTLRTIAKHAAQLTHSDSATIFLSDEGKGAFRVGASYRTPAGYLREAERLGILGTRPLPGEPRERQPLITRSALERRVLQVSDIGTRRRIRGWEFLVRWGYRAYLAAPLLLGGRIVGSMVVRRRRPDAFSEQEVALLSTFARQSAVALEHARLFQESQARNRELEAALAQQTVTSDFVKAISRSSFDLQAVLQALVEQAVRLCQADGGIMCKLGQDGAYHLAAHHRAHEAFVGILQAHPQRPGREGLVSRTALEGQAVHIGDVLEDGEYRWLDAQRAGDYRTALGVPLIREGVVIGVISLWRREVRPFSGKQIGLLTTFADQAVIAIENARLFAILQARTEELARSVEELRTLGQTMQAVNTTLDLGRVLTIISQEACRLCEADAGLITEFIEATREFRPSAGWNVSRRLIQAIQASPPAWGTGATGRSAAAGTPVQIPDILAEPGYPFCDILSAEGYRAIMSIPLRRDGRVLGTLAVARRSPGPFTERHVKVLAAFADQTTIAIEHARLFRDLSENSRMLEEANRHKNQFVASMSHELRTPLNAIIGFSEVLLDPSLTVSEAERQQFLTDILSSGKHLLKLINEVLDLAKIEAGRMELQIAPSDLGDVLEVVQSTMRPLAAKKAIALHVERDPALVPVPMDAARIRQVLLNLVGNALKFTPEGGQVWVSARRGDDGSGGELQRSRGAEEQRRTGAAEDAPLPLGSSAPLQFVEVSVRDTGPGIPPEDHERIFLEFQQAEAAGAASKAEGTGLGLALARKFVELHGGGICVTSEVGSGATFTFTLPLAPPSESPDISSDSGRVAHGR